MIPNVKRKEVSWVKKVGFLSASIIFVGWGGLHGILASAALAVLMYRVPPMYAVGFGQFALVGIVDGKGLMPIILGEAGLFAVLITPAVWNDIFGREVVRLSSAVGVLSGMAYAGLTWYDSTLAAAVLCLGTFVGAAYCLVWYDRATLNITEV